MVESPDSTPMQTSPTANSVATAHQVTQRSEPPGQRGPLPA